MTNKITHQFAIWWKRQQDAGNDAPTYEETFLAAWQARDAEVAEFGEALSESQSTMHHAWNRIHCLPRTTDTALANCIDSRMAANRNILAKHKQEG